VSLVGDELDDTILRNIPQENRLELYQKLVHYLSVVEERKKMSLRDAATIILGTLLISTSDGIIVVIPFFLMDSKLPFFLTGDIETALKISNLLGILLLFVVGYYRAFSKDLSSKIISGIDTSLIGVIITVVTIVLGG
jgi:VIT1/CCC1 family predicted Fe2+/Mn2+ transporter